MLAALQQTAAQPSAAKLQAHTHVLFVLPSADAAVEFAGDGMLRALMARRGVKADALAKSPLAGNLAHGAAAAWVVVDAKATRFEQHAAVRLALQPLLAEGPADIAIVLPRVAQRPEWTRAAASAAVYSAWLNGAVLPELKKKRSRKPLKRIALYGYRAADGFADERARAEGNTLSRELTMLPPNELTPRLYRARLRRLARERGWRMAEYDFNRLRRMGAGAFCAVAQGSGPNGGDAAIVHLRYSGPRAKQRVALVGKGICFDTGGHNLKPARYMHGMHEDMNGSATALGILYAASALRLPVVLDVWLAIAQNHLSPAAYKQNDVVNALNGTSIEVIHTDAEGRMVLADTLTLAARAKPDLILDFATLTGSMHTALGDRYSGIFATSDALAAGAIAAGRACGERVCAFPFDDDYDSALDSAVADVKQCTLEGGGDHILATRLLQRFTEGRPWIHMDLSASNCKGGLGAVASEVTGFGVSWGVELLRGM